MLPFNSWGDPYTEDYSWRDLKVGDRAQVKPSVPVTGRKVGTLTKIDEATDTYTIKFDDGAEMSYDADMLMKP